MTQQRSSQNPFQQIEDDLHLSYLASDEIESAPSLPVILLAAATGLGLFMIVLYVSYRVLTLNIPVSVGIATMALLVGIGMVGGGLSFLTNPRSTLSNLTFSCGLILLTILFFGLCGLAGAIGATLFLVLGN